MVAEHGKIKLILKTACGHIEGILRMIDEDRYCIEIAEQLSAVSALLKKARGEVLAAHLTHCVKNARGEDADKKIEEIIKIIQK